jgi:hypothetical protein
MEGGGEANLPECARVGGEMSVKPFAFVLMPFETGFDDIYKLGIQATAKECGVVAERVDEQSFSETILERIYRQIGAADFIIADMTGRNPNVFYEVGYAHALGKLCTLLTQTADDIPFDLKHHRHIVYEGSIQTLKSRLAVELQWLKEEMQRKRLAPISVVLKSIYGDLEKSEWSADAEVEFTFDLFNRTTRKSPEIEAMYLQTSKGWRFRQGDDRCASTSVEGDSGKVRHFIKPPVTRLSPGAWAQVKLTGTKQVWNKYSGDEYHQTYNLSGFADIEIFTSEGNYAERVNVELEVSEVPF